MSSERQRLKSAIQRIAKEDPEIRSLLGEGQNKGGKASSAGVGVSDAERDRICCDGSTSGSANPGTDEREVGDSQSGLDSNDPADIGGGDGTLDGVTDCATGEPICFDGAGFIPPDGWDDPSSPPLPDDWEPGFYYRSGAKQGGFPVPTQAFLSCGSAAEHLKNQLPTDCASEPIPLFIRDGECPSSSDGGISCNGFWGVFEWTRLSCADSYLPELCDEGATPEPVDSWPSDGCTNLSVVGGKIVGSKYDPDQDGSYSAPRDSIRLCSGADEIELAPAANGGFKTINPTTDNGYLYNSKNERIAHIDGNEYSDPTI